MSTINLEYSEGGKYIPSALQALRPIHTFCSTGTSPYTYLPLFRHFTLYIPSALQALRPIQPSALQVLCPIQPSVSALQIPTFRYRHFAQYNFPYSTVPILEIHTFRYRHFDQCNTVPTLERHMYPYLTPGTAPKTTSIPALSLHR